jgi:hypothetical protein
MSEPSKHKEYPRAFVARNGKLVPFDYDAALRLAQQAHMLAGTPKPGSAQPGR